MIIWLASYPRSGNTFLRVILKSVFGLSTYSIYNDILDIAKDAASSKVVGHKMLPDDFDLEAARKSEELFLIKTHEILKDCDDKVIYLVRDGRQNAVSYLHYLKTYHDQSYTVQDVVFGNVFWGCWGDHIDQWNPRNRENTLLLRFEDLVSSPRSFLEQISDFLGLEQKSEEIPDFKLLNAINPEFFRQGKTDSWKIELEQDDINAFWLNNFKQMREFFPGEKIPDLFRDDPNIPQISELFRQQRTYYQTLSTDLRQRARQFEKQIGILQRTISNLESKASSREQSISNLNERISNQEQRISDQEKQISIREDRILHLEHQFHATVNRLRAIEFAIGELVAVKFLKSPVLKFRMYKKLVEVFFANVG